MVGVDPIKIEPIDDGKNDPFKDVWVILEGNVVVNVIAWDGVLYDADTSPKGWTPPEGVTYISHPKLSDTDEPIEVGSILDTKTGIFTRLEPVETPPPEKKPITQSDKLAQLLIEKGLITKDDVSDLGIVVSDVIEK